MSYLSHWGLENSPFRRGDHSRFFAGSSQREAIARLNYLIGGGLSCGLLLSYPSCGLTSILRHVSRSAGFGNTAVEMVLTSGDQDSASAVWTDLARALRVRPDPTSAPSRISDLIAVASRQGVRTIWLQDRSQTFAAQVARQLIDQHHAMTVVMGAGPDQAKELSVALGHCPLRIELCPLSVDEAAQYVSESLAASRRVVVPASRKQVFTDSALIRLHELSEGRIGQINDLCELSLMVAAANNFSQIDARLLESVCEETVRAAA